MEGATGGLTGGNQEDQLIHRIERCRSAIVFPIAQRRREVVVELQGFPLAGGGGLGLIEAVTPHLPVFRSDRSRRQFIFQVHGDDSARRGRRMNVHQHAHHTVTGLERVRNTGHAVEGKSVVGCTRITHITQHVR